MATITYKCTVCKRQLERVENVYGLDTFAKCVITAGCRGKLRKTGRNPDNIRESFPKFETNLQDYAPRNAFAQHQQDIASNLWVVTHGLNTNPSVVVFVKDSAGVWQPLPKDSFSIEPIDSNVITLSFPSPTAGIVQFAARSSATTSAALKAEASSSTQVSVGGSFVFALPKFITNGGSTIDLKTPISDIKLEVVLEKPNQEEVWCFEKLTGMLDLTPWSGIDEVLVAKRRNYYLKTKNILNFSTFNNPDLTFADIPEGTRLRIVAVDYGTGVTVSVESKALLLLLAAAPYEFNDKVRNKFLDLGELFASGRYLTYSNGEFFVDSAAIEKTYPPIEAARKVGPVPPLPSPTPTPTVSPTISVTPTNTVTPTVTRTATPTPTATASVSASVTPTVTPTISVTPSVTQSLTPTPTPTVSGTATPTPTISVTPTISITPSATPAVTPSITASVTPTPTPSVTPSPSAALLAGDPYAVNYSSLLHFDGANGSSTYTDAYGRVWTATGATLTNAQSKFGGTSATFASGQYITTPDEAGIRLNGGVDFTLEAWIYPTSASGTFLPIATKDYVNGSSYWSYFFGIDTGKLRFSAGDGNTTAPIQTVDSSTSLTLNAWSHVVAQRRGSNYELYINGTQVASVAVSTAVGNGTKVLEIGAFHTQSANSFPGYIDEFRLTRGTAVYTGAFTAPTSPFTNGRTVTLLHLNGTNGSTTITDVKGKTWTVAGNAQISTAQSKFGGASLLLDGTGDYLSSADNSDWHFGGKDYTLEAFVRFVDFNATNGVSPQIISLNNNGGGGTQEVRIFTDGSGHVRAAVYDGSYVIGPLTGTSVMATGTWYHVAFVRSGGNHYLFLNGNLEASSTASYTLTNLALTALIGAGDPGAGRGYINGNVDEARITLGAGRYTANFTPPAAAFYDTVT